MVFQCINIRQVPREVLKTAAYGLGFQHLPRDLANVNSWKTMFDPYIEEGAIIHSEGWRTVVHTLFYFIFSKFKEENKVINHDWIKNHACSLRQKIHVVTYIFV